MRHFLGYNDIQCPMRRE